MTDGTENPSSPRIGRLSWLQALRGVAALGVVMTHARFIFMGTTYWDKANFAFLPFASGVDLFFVISGFIMYVTTRSYSGAGATVTFAKKRFLRIWPAYAVLSLATLVLFGGIRAIVSAENLSQLVKSIFFIPVTFDGIYGKQTISQGWTLNFEVYFYLIFGLAILFGRFRWIFFWSWMAGTLIIIPLIFGTHWNPYETYNVNYPISYMKLACNPIISEFLFGIIAGYIFLSPFSIKSKKLCYALVSIAIPVSVAAIWLLYVYINPYMGLVFAFDIAIFAVCSKSIPIRFGRFLEKSGDVSYTLYLINLAVVSIIINNITYGKIYSREEGVAIYMIVVVSSLIAAFLISPLVERKLPSVLEAAFSTALYRVQKVIRPASA